MITWSEFWRYFSWAFLATAIPVAIMIMLEKRSPHKTAAWILVLILLPFFGIIFYLIFGQEYRKQKIFSRRGIKSLGKFRRLASKQLREIEQTHFSFSPQIMEKENIIRLLLNNSNSLLTTGNKAKLLIDGVATFEAIFKAVELAKHHIHLEYYIFSDDEIGNRFKQLLIEKSKLGVEVRIIIDDVGSWGLNQKFLDDFTKNGIEIYSFMEVRFPRLTSRVNFRNHRKIVIIDGKIGFTGGINVADRYLHGNKKIGNWRDTHLQITGDAVACLQVVFAADWFFVVNENLSGTHYFPVFTEKKGIPIQISASGPDSDWENIGQAFFAAISNARKKIFITTPYLMPPPPILTALKTAALSSVDVRIIIPEFSDARTAKWCSFSYVEELLEAGVKIFFYQNGFIHSKYMLVDDIFSTIGSTNLDFRSLETNFEVNAFLYDEKFTQTLDKLFKSDLKNCRLLKLQEWSKRPWHFKVRESLAHIVSPMF